MSYPTMCMFIKFEWIWARYFVVKVLSQRVSFQNECRNWWISVFGFFIGKGCEMIGFTWFSCLFGATWGLVVLHWAARWSPTGGLSAWATWEVERTLRNVRNPMEENSIPFSPSTLFWANVRQMEFSLRRFQDTLNRSVAKFTFFEIQYKFRK